MIAFSYHRECIGKPEKRIVDGKLQLWIGDKRINLGYGWITAELPFEDIYEMLSVGGYAFAPAINSDHRIEQNFISHELALVDIDGGMTLDELQQFPFYQLYGSGYYTTPSHTAEQHKFRILYRLPCAITDAETMRVIYEGLLAVHGFADIACKDPVRLFFGTINARHRERTDRMIDAEGLQCLIQARDIVLEHKQAELAVVVENFKEHDPKTPEQVGELLDELRKYHGDLNYSTRRDVTWAVANAVGASMAVSLMRQRWSDHDKNGKYEVIVNSRRSTGGKQVSLGTIYHMIRKHNPKFGRRSAPNSQQLHTAQYVEYRVAMNQVEEIKKYIKELEDGSIN
jgi:hypothetical protein